MRTSETNLRPLHLQRKGTPVPQLNSYSLPNDFYKTGHFYNDLCLEEMFFNFADLCTLSAVMINNIPK